MTLSAFVAMETELGNFRNKLVTNWLKDKVVAGNFKKTSQGAGNTLEESLDSDAELRDPGTLGNIWNSTDVFRGFLQLPGSNPSNLCFCYGI